MQNSERQCNGEVEDTRQLQEIRKSMKEIEIPNVFVLGAGFSAPVGLPLTQQLFEQIRQEARAKTWMSEIIEMEYERFTDYVNDTFEQGLAERKLKNIEDFVSFLDVEHFLSLRGADTDSAVGNQAQVIIRNLICKVLFRAMKQIQPEQFELYLRFCENLKPRDIIITFNYDTILEHALCHLRKPFRFQYFGDFPDEYDDEDNDIILLKMHGSMNWFDITYFDNFNKSLRDNMLYVQPQDVIFNDHRRIFCPSKTFPYAYRNSPFFNIYSIKKIEEYLRFSNYATICPLIISPSYTKVVYLNPLKELWFDFNNMGIITETLAIIGFSLPAHDDYLRIPIYRLVHNFQKLEDESVKPKTHLKIVDYRTTDQEKQLFKETYSFIDWEKTDVHFDGFNEKAIDMIFETG